MDVALILDKIIAAINSKPLIVVLLAALVAWTIVFLRTGKNPLTSKSAIALDKISKDLAGIHKEIKSITDPNNKN